MRTGGLVSCTVMRTSSAPAAPCGSATTRVTGVLPRENAALGRTPVAPPVGHDQVKVRESPSGSYDAAPSRVTTAPAAFVASITWSLPARAMGGRFIGPD